MPLSSLSHPTSWTYFTVNLCLLICHLKRFFPLRISKITLQDLFQRNQERTVSLLLWEFHWLPVQFRVEYKLATPAAHCFDGSSPPCLSSPNIYQRACSLRSNEKELADVIPAVWNFLPARMLATLPPLFWFQIWAEILSPSENSSSVKDPPPLTWRFCWLPFCSS